MKSEHMSSNKGAEFESYSLNESIEDSLVESEKIFQLAPDAIIKIDINGNLIKANLKACELFKYNLEELLNANISCLIEPNEHIQHDNYIRKFFQGNEKSKIMGASRGRLVALDKYGVEIPVEVTISLITLKKGTFALAIIRDVTEKEDLIGSLQRQLQENKKLLHLAIVDELTQTYNIRHFNETLEKEFYDFKRFGHDTSLMILDIDFFKKVNDKHGHIIGNEVLILFRKKN